MHIKDRKREKWIINTIYFTKVDYENIGLGNYKYTASIYILFNYKSLISLI